MTTGVRAFALGLMIFSTGCTRAPASAPRAQATSLATWSKDAQGGAGAIEETRTVKAWFCFSWVHGRDFASPCFSNAHACAQAFAKDAHRDKKKCSEYSGTVTCVPRGGDEAGARDEQRCFQ